MVNTDEFALRKKALDRATEYVKEIVQEFPPQDYKITHPGGGALSPAPSTTMTSSEQIVEMLLNVGSWLLGEVRP